MDAYLSELVRYLVAQSWQIAVLTMAVAVAACVLWRRSAHVRYLLWLIVLAKCLVPPLYLVPVRVLPETVPERVPPVLSGAIWGDEHFNFPSPPASTPRHEPEGRERRESVLVPSVPPTSEPRLSVWGWLGVLWIAGAGGYLLMNLLRALRGSCWLRRTRRPPADDVQADTADLLPAYGIKRLPKIWIVEGVGQPFVWGLVRGSIYLPPGFFAIESPEHRRDILAHELSHVLRFDAAVNMLQVIAQALFWFHPVIWWANRKVRQEREKVCDEMAVARLGSRPREYSTAIVSALIQAQESTRRVPSLAVAGPVKNLEERIKTMLTPGKKFYKRPSLVTASIIFLAAVLIVPTTLVLVTRAQATPTPEVREELAKSLYKAIQSGDIAEVKRLLAAGADVTTPANSETLTPLGEAAIKGHAEIVKLLLEKGADVEDANDYFTPLFYAIWSEDPATVKALIAGGADVNVLPDEKNYPPLVYAIWTNNASIVEVVLNAGADIHTRTDAVLTGTKGVTSVYWAAQSNKALRDLILAKSNLHNTVHLAAYRGELEEVKRLIDRGAGFDVRDENGCTPLHWAILGGAGGVAEHLIAEGAEVNATDNLGNPPLLWALELPMVKLLVAHGANLQAAQADGRTRLHTACIHGQRDVLEFLLAKGGDIEREDKNNTPPWVYAVAYGHINTVEFLIGRGVDLSKTGPEGRTLVDIAKQGKHTEVVNLLRQRGVKETLFGAAIAGAIDDARKLISAGEDVNKRNSLGQTPLHSAARRGREVHRQVAEILIDAGANVDARDREGKTPLVLAQEANRTAMVELLRQRGAKE